jgi:hypothetical protein
MHLLYLLRIFKVVFFASCHLNFLLGGAVNRDVTRVQEAIMAEELSGSTGGESEDENVFITPYSFEPTTSSSSETSDDNDDYDHEERLANNFGTV